MKATYFILAALILYVACPNNSSAIEGLTISVQCSNVVLSWPSIDGETYIVQYRPTLDPSTPWQTLTASLPADVGTNITFFVHSNIVQNPVCDGGSFSMMSSGSMSASSLNSSGIEPDIPMAMKSDGAGAAPLMLYPPGFDLSSFVIFDPLTGQTVSGSGYEVSSQSSRTLQPDGIQPDGTNEPAGSGGAGGMPDMAFYQVARVGVHILGLTNLTSAVVSDTINIPFEAANDIGTLQDVSVLVDGVRYRGAAPLLAPGISGSIAVDTSFLENGDHTFQIQGTWLNPDVVTDPNNVFLEQTSDPFTLSVSNIIYFPEWEDEVGELGFSAYFAKTTCTNADWQIDIYDSGSNYVQTLSGHTDDGTIETNWDMTDWQGNVRTNADLDPSFSGIITVADPQKKKLPPKKAPLPYPSQGSWIITYQDVFHNMLNSNDLYTAIYDMGSVAANFGGAYTVPPSSNPTNGQTFPLRYSNTNEPPVPGYQIIADEHALESLLTNSMHRNFFYTGHGGGNSFATFNTDMLALFLDRHYFRFVYMNGCETANGALPATFGINFNAPQSLSYFQAHGIRPRAYMGNKTKVGYAQGGIYTDPNTGATCYGKIPPEVTEFLDNIEFYLYFNYPLSQCLYNATLDTPQDLGPFWDTGQQTVIYGYADLRVNDYNYKSDWSN